MADSDNKGRPKKSRKYQNSVSSDDIESREMSRRSPN